MPFRGTHGLTTIIAHITHLQLQLKREKCIIHVNTWMHIYVLIYTIYTNMHTIYTHIYTCKLCLHVYVHTLKLDYTRLDTL